MPFDFSLIQNFCFNITGMPYLKIKFPFLMRYTRDNQNTNSVNIEAMQK